MKCKYCGIILEKNKINKKFCSMDCKDSYNIVKREIKKDLISKEQNE